MRITPPFSHPSPRTSGEQPQYPQTGITPSARTAEGGSISGTPIIPPRLFDRQMSRVASRWAIRQGATARNPLAQVLSVSVQTSVAMRCPRLTLISLGIVDTGRGLGASRRRCIVLWREAPGTGAALGWRHVRSSGLRAPDWLGFTGAAAWTMQTAAFQKTLSEPDEPA